VTATGDGVLGYQWLKNGTNLSNGGHYSGVTTESLTITDVDANDLAGYQCMVSAGCGSVTSSNAVLLNRITSSVDFAVNRPIPEGVMGLSDTRTITNSSHSLTSVKVKLKISGTYNGDLFCYLRRASGYSVLLNRVGRTASKPFGYDDPGLDVTFDDGDINDVHSYRAIVTGNPNTPLGTSLTGSWVADGRTANPALVLDTEERPALLNAFTNHDPNGEWTLFVADMAMGDSHTLISWGLEISSGEEHTLPVAGVDVYTRNRGMSYKIKIADLLTNDTGDAVYFSGLNLATTNGVTLTTNATTIFYVNTNNVEDQITYSLRDRHGNLAVGRVLIQIAGSTTGSLTVVRLQTDVPGPDTNTLTLAGIPNYQYVVQFATNALGNPWFNLSTNTAGANGLWTVQDPTATNSERIYRVSTW
jgi:subtilisin-like proprotein convertase family protein